jgi:RimJ/RimL family protein N-acetyltransferase
MSLATEILTQRCCERSIPVLETERLMLRAPRRGDIKAIVRLANDRRVAENTARLPHPYRAEDAERFIAAGNRVDGETAFVVTLGGEPIGVCGVELRESAAEIGYWLGVPYWGRGYATEAVRAMIDHAFGALGHDVLAAGARVTNPASRRVAGEMRISVDRRRSLSHPRYRFFGAARPLPPRPRPVGVAQSPGARQRGGVSRWFTALSGGHGRVHVLTFV